MSVSPDGQGGVRKMVKQTQSIARPSWKCAGRHAEIDLLRRCRHPSQVCDLMLAKNCVVPQHLAPARARRRCTLELSLSEHNDGIPPLPIIKGPSGRGELRQRRNFIPIELRFHRGDANAKLGKRLMNLDALS